MGRNFEMTLEESIALAEKFQKDLAQLESYERQIIDNEAESKKPIVVDVKKRSMFRYFWPWLVFAVVLFGFLDVLVLFFLTSKYSNFSGLVFLIAVVLTIAVIIIGVFVSKKKQKADNEAYEIAYDIAQERRSSLFEKNKELKSNLSQLEFQLAANPNFALIPEDKRKSSSLARAKLFLQSGKATDFEDALKKV